MATKELIIGQLKRLAAVHQNVKITPEMISEYVEVLGACLPEDLESATNEMIANNKYFPKIAEIWQASERALLERLERVHGRGMANKLMMVSEKVNHDYRSYAEEA